MCIGMYVCSCILIFEASDILVSWIQVYSNIFPEMDNLDVGRWDQNMQYIASIIDYNRLYVYS